MPPYKPGPFPAEAITYFLGVITKMFNAESFCFCIRIFLRNRIPNHIKITRMALKNTSIEMMAT